MPALVGLCCGLVLVGPGLGRGALLNLDLVATDHWPTPRSVWALGPELPRAVPLEVLFSLTSLVVSGATAVKVFYIGAVAAAFAGMHRLVLRLGRGPGHAWMSAFLYGLSPFLATRMGVGHLTMVGAYALLPHAHPRLLRPSDSLARTYLACMLLSLMGFYGGLLAGISVGTGMVFETRRRPLPVVLTLAASQLVWFVPGVVLIGQGPQLGDSSRFPSGLEGWLGPFRLITGHGFWLPSLEVGGEATVVMVVSALAVAALAVAGWSEIPRAWRSPALVTAIVSAMLMMADAVPGLGSLYAELSGIPGLSALREPQRLYPFIGIVVAVAVPAGAIHASHRVSEQWRTATVLSPLAVAAVLAAPAVWGLDGQLRPVEIPTEWSQARAAIRAEPGTVLVLPWHRYQNVALAGQRRVLNPAIQYFGPDVLVSGDLELGPRSRETAEPREDRVLNLLPAIRRGEAVSAELATMGVRWVLILHDVDYESYLPVLADPGVESRMANAHLDLLSITRWVGPVIDQSGDAVDLDRPIAPLVRLDRAVAGTWFEPWTWGWMQGWRMAGKSDTGLVQLPGDSRNVWYLPAVIVVVADAVWVGLLAISWSRRTSRRPAGATIGGDYDHAS